VSFSQITKCAKTVTFINPANPGQSFTVNPSRTEIQRTILVTSVDEPVTLPSWLCAVDAQGNPLHPHLRMLIAEGSVTVA